MTFEMSEVAHFRGSFLKAMKTSFEAICQKRDLVRAATPSWFDQHANVILALHFPPFWSRSLQSR